MANFPFETTRTAIQLVLNGVVDRYPGVRIILSHAGGFLPYASLRFAELAWVFNPAAPSPDALLAGFRHFYFDTALSSGAGPPTLKAFARPGHILFGTDSPYDHGVAAAFTAALDPSDSLTADDQASISHRNAQALFPRLAPRPGAAAGARRRAILPPLLGGTETRVAARNRMDDVMPNHALERDRRGMDIADRQSPGPPVTDSLPLVSDLAATSSAKKRLEFS